MRDVMLQDHLVIEGAAGVDVAGYRHAVREPPALRARESVVVLCGGNVSAGTLTRVLAEPG